MSNDEKVIPLPYKDFFADYEEFLTQRLSIESPNIGATKIQRKRKERKMSENELIKKEDSSLPFWLMDRLDDDLIVQELEGRLPQVLTYHFSDRGQEVWGLSKAGVDEATCELAKKGEVIRELEMSFTDGEKEGLFQVKSGRYVISKEGKEILLDTKFGFKRQPKKTYKGNDNVFWYEQGAIKAARNASMRLIPKSIVEAVIQYAKSQGKVKEINPQDEIPPSSIPEHGGKLQEKSGCISKKQAGRFYAIAKGTGASDETIKAWLFNGWGYRSTLDISLSNYEDICNQVQMDFGKQEE